MKREILRHPKLYDLCARLGINRPEALGLLNLLFDMTAEVATGGDIGKWPDGAIARGCDFMGDPRAFVEALTAAGWLDEDDEHRLVVHDWPDHCERWVKSKLQSLGLTFCSCYSRPSPSSEDTSGDISQDAFADPPRDRTEPNRTKPLNTGRPGGRPVKGSDASAEAYATIVVTQAEWDAAVPLMQDIKKSIQPSGTLKPKDRQLAASTAIIAQRRGGEAWLRSLLEDYRDRGAPADKPWGWLKGAASKSAIREGWDFLGVLRSLEIPPEFIDPKVKKEATAA